MKVQFENIDDYMKHSRDERRFHLKLNESCIEIGGHSSTVFKGLLAYFLKTTIPTRHKIHLCHACNNSKCSNPEHLYWGSPKDNVADTIKAGNFGGNKKKSELQMQHAQKLGKRFGGTHISKEKSAKVLANIAVVKKVFESSQKEWGWKTKLASDLGVSHTQITRYLKKIIPG